MYFQFCLLFFHSVMAWWNSQGNLNSIDEPAYCFAYPGLIRNRKQNDRMENGANFVSERIPFHFGYWQKECFSASSRIPRKYKHVEIMHVSHRHGNYKNNHISITCVSFEASLEAIQLFCLPKSIFGSHLRTLHLLIWPLFPMFTISSSISMVVRAILFRFNDTVIRFPADD